MRRDRDDGKEAEIKEEREKQCSGYGDKKRSCSESVMDQLVGKSCHSPIANQDGGGWLPPVSRRRFKLGYGSECAGWRRENCPRVTTIRLLGLKEDPEAKKRFIPGVNIARGSGRRRMWEWEVFAEGQLAHPSPPWDVSQLLCPLASLDNCCPTEPQKVGCTRAVCGRGEGSPQLSWPSALLVLCGQRRKKLHVFCKSICSYCSSLPVFLETSQGCVWRQQSRLLRVLKWFTGTPPQLSPAMAWPQRMPAAGAEHRGCLVKEKPASV